MKSSRFALSQNEIDIVATNLMNKFIEIRKESNIIPVKGGPVVLAEAADLAAIGANAADVSEMLTLQRIKDKNDMVNDLMERYLPYMALIALGLGIPAAIYVVLSSLH